MKHLSKYELVEEIGRGGFAVVYKARDLDLDRLVALKVLAPHLSWDPTFAKRFRLEAQAAAKLRHANIITIYEVNEAEGQLYIAMEYLPGRTLAALLNTEGAMSVTRALPVMEQVADALDYAHEQGMIHRDVKPSNVVVEEDRRGTIHATLMDFGLVKAMESSESLTSLGTLLGSPQYMAPEQADHSRKSEVGPATDRYALGVVAYEVLTGKVPFPGNTPSTLVAHMQQTPPDPRSIRDDLPVSVAQVLLKALSKSPGERYPTAIAMVEALGATTRPEPGPTPEVRPSLALDLSVKPQAVDAGEEVAWTLSLLNSGDDDLRGVTVKHDRRLLDDPFDLAVGEELHLAFATTYKTKGRKIENVTITGIASNGETVRNTASASVQVRAPRLPSDARPRVSGRFPTPLAWLFVFAGVPIIIELTSDILTLGLDCLAALILGIPIISGVIGGVGMLQKKKWGWWAGILHCSILVVDGTFWTLIRLADRDRILYSGVMMLGIGLYGLIAMLKPTVREHFGT
jgi:serine/threonine protein kinase